MFERHVYQIHVVECMNEVLKKLKSLGPKGNFSVSVEEYELRLHEAVLAYEKSVHIDLNTSEEEKYKQRIISPNHPAFDFWLALFLSTITPSLIPLVLDEYRKGKFGEIDNLIGIVEFFVLRNFENVVPYECNLHKKEVVTWVREERNRLELKEIVTLNNTESGSNDDLLAFQIDTERELIQTDLDFDSVIQYFSILKKFRYKSTEQFVDDETIENLVLSNFYFKNKQRVESKGSLNLIAEKQVLKEIVYVFYSKKDEIHYKRKIDVYVHFLINNFTSFHKNSFATLKSTLNHKSNRPY